MRLFSTYSSFLYFHLCFVFFMSFFVRLSLHRKLLLLDKYLSDWLPEETRKFVECDKGRELG